MKKILCGLFLTSTLMMAGENKVENVAISEIGYRETFVTDAFFEPYSVVRKSDDNLIIVIPEKNVFAITPNDFKNSPNVKFAFYNYDFTYNNEQYRGIISYPYSDGSKSYYNNANKIITGFIKENPESLIASIEMMEEIIEY